LVPDQQEQLKQWQYPVPELSLLQLLLSKVLAVPGSGAVSTFDAGPVF
jgi:hypothetical protein